MRGQIILPANRYRAPGYVRLVMPTALPPGMQRVKARVRMRLATCREVGCEEERCRRLHKLPDWEQPTYEYEVGGERRVVTESEFVDRLQEGTYTIQYFRTRGL